MRDENKSGELEGEKKVVSWKVRTKVLSWKVRKSGKME